MDITQEQAFYCPYCSASNAVEVDLSCDLEQQFVQDCRVCCQPVEISVSDLDEQVSVVVRQENE